MRKRVRFLLIPLLATILSSCSGFKVTRFIYDVPLKTVKHEISETNYYQHDHFDSISYLDNGVSKSINSVQDVKRARNEAYIKSGVSGDHQILVVPVHINHEPSVSLNYKEEKGIIEAIFFGSKAMNEYYSVAEYYMRSSYGSLRLLGEVTNPITTSKVYEDNATSALASEIRNDILTQLLNSKFDYSKYIVEVEGKKYLENVFLVYDRKTSDLSDSLWWAFSYNQSSLIKDDIYASNTAWASLEFSDYANKNINSQAFIHETGHLLGLEDYYSDDIYQPLGGFDMMDLNVGDHSSLSKMMFNWITPKVVTDSGEITISPLSQSGDVIIVPASNAFKSGSYHPYQEYLLIDMFDTSEVNNCLNKTYKTSSGNIFTFPNEIGIRIYHVDARLAYFFTSSKLRENKEADYFIKYLDDSSKELGDNYHVEYRYRNFDKRNTDKDNVLIHLLESSGLNTFKEGKLASNQTLFKTDDSLKEFSFHDGSKLLYSIKIKSLNRDSATILFSKI